MKQGSNVESRLSSRNGGGCRTEQCHCFFTSSFNGYNTPTDRVNALEHVQEHDPNLNRVQVNGTRFRLGKQATSPPAWL